MHLTCRTSSKAKTLIIATGNGSWKHRYGGNTCTGETFGVALRAGVHLRNFEYLKVWNVPAEFCWEGQTMLLPLGARFVNANGEDFMKRDSPTFRPVPLKNYSLQPESYYMDSFIPLNSQVTTS